MGFRVAQVSTFNDGLKRKAICLLFMAMLIQPSSAVIMRTGFIDYLLDMDPDEMALFISELVSRIDTAVPASENFWPGIVLSTTVAFDSGLSMMVIVAFWNQPTCNLGRGGELRYPIRRLLGDTVRRIIFSNVLPAIESLIYNYMGYGFAIHENISVFYFPAVYSPWLTLPSDNDPDSHRHTEVDAFKYFANQTVNPDARGKLSVPPASSNSSYRGISKVSLSSSRSTANVSDVPRSDNFTKAVTHRAFDVGHNSSNTTNGLMAPKKKFPADPYGDCDLPSLVLMFGLGPSIDDQNGHGIQVLNPTDKIWSPNTRFGVVMQTDCNLVLYDYVAQLSLWSSETNDMASVCYATITMYGELVVYDIQDDDVLFRTKTWCTGNGGKCWTNTILEIQDDGNLVLYFAETGVSLWSSNTVVCDGGC